MRAYYLRSPKLPRVTPASKTSVTSISSFSSAGPSEQSTAITQAASTIPNAQLCPPDWRAGARPTSHCFALAPPGRLGLRETPALHLLHAVLCEALKALRRCGRLPLDGDAVQASDCVC